MKRCKFLCKYTHSQIHLDRQWVWERERERERTERGRGSFYPELPLATAIKAFQPCSLHCCFFQSPSLSLSPSLSSVRCRFVCLLLILVELKHIFSRTHSSSKTLYGTGFFSALSLSLSLSPALS